MALYYVALPTRSQAFMLERRLKIMDVPCEITYMPREIMTDLCNMGIRFEEEVLEEAITVIRRSGIPNIRIYKEVLTNNYATYMELGDF